MEFLLGISLFVNVVIFIGFGVFINAERKIFNKEKSDLLNRVMAKDYKEYAVFEAHKEEQRDVLAPPQDVFPVN